MLRRRIGPRPGAGIAAPAAPIANGAGGLAEQAAALQAELDRLAAALETVREQSSPMLWNEIEGAVPDSLGTITEAVRAVAADDHAFYRALEFAVERFRDCAQGPLLAALDPGELRALLAADAIPVPPPEARESYFAGDDMSYWTSGLGDRLLLEDLGRRLGRPLAADSRLLDFGSSSGRVLRHFATAAPQMRAFGVDLGRRSVEWVRHHMPPALTVLDGTTLPHLPFPDGHFDCIYAGSVFTHIDAFEEAWLLELSRVLAPRGFAVLTFHPERVWNEIGSDPEHWCRRSIECGPHRLDPRTIEPVGVEVFDQAMPAGRVVLTLTTWPVNNANVFHSHAWIRERWGRFFEVESIIERAHADYQDAAVLIPRA